MLLNAGAEIDITDIAGWTPLHVASHFQRHDVIKVLLFKGANSSIKNRENLTAKELARDFKTKKIF